MNTKQLPRTIIKSSHGYSVTFVVSGSENDNAYTIVEVTLPAGEGTDKHYHLALLKSLRRWKVSLG